MQKPQLKGAGRSIEPKCAAFRCTIYIYFEKSGESQENRCMKYI